MSFERLRRVLKGLWWFIWEDTSVWSWIANVVLAFVLIKFVVYPVLGFLLGTGYPVVAVVSSSMEHDGDFEQWWAREQCVDAKTSQRVANGELYAEFGISRDDFNGYAFKNGFNKGDVMILKSPDGLGIGDVLVFWADGREEPIIHRIVQVKEAGGVKTFRTKGDNNCASAGFEHNIGRERMIGKAVLRIPLLGWIKIVFVELVRLVVGVMR